MASPGTCWGPSLWGGHGPLGPLKYAHGDQWSSDGYSGDASEAGRQYFLKHAVFWLPAYRLPPSR